MSHTLVLEPGFGFASIEARLAGLGFQRDASVRPATPDIRPGEPELAAWVRNDERLTYTFNPVVSLRVLTGRGLNADATSRLSTELPVLGSTAIGGLLAEREPRRLLLGLFAARALGAAELAPAAATLTAHPNQTISQAAWATLEALAFGPGSTSRDRALAVMRLLCEQAIPVVAALVGPEGKTATLALRPQPEDFARVFDTRLADAARQAYDTIWQVPPEVEFTGSGQLSVRVDAAPAGMLREANELSHHFPGGYRALAPYLVPNRIWFVWQYIAVGDDRGVRYDGLVRLVDRWVWFPKPHRVAGEILKR